MEATVEKIETETIENENLGDHMVKVDPDVVVQEHEYQQQPERMNGEDASISSNSNGDGTETEYKLTYQEDCECETITDEQQEPQEQVIIENTEHSEQHHHYHIQNGEGSNLYVISTVTTAEDGTQHEGQYIATSEELYEAANAVGGQIVNISDLASGSDLMQGQHIIIDGNGTPVLLDSSGIIDESAYLMDHQEVVVQGEGMEVVEEQVHDRKEIIDHVLQNNADNLLQFHSVDIASSAPEMSSNPMVTQTYYSMNATTSSAQPIQNSIQQNPLGIVSQTPKPSTPKIRTIKQERRSFSSTASIDDTIMAVIRQASQAGIKVEGVKRPKGNEMKGQTKKTTLTPVHAHTSASAATTITPVTKRTIAPAIILPPPPPLTAAPIINLAPLLPPSTPIVTTPKKESYDSSDMDEKSPAPTQQPQAHTVIMVKDRRKRSRHERNPMELPFSYAGQSFNVQSQKLILNVMHFFKCHKEVDFLDAIKTPQEKAARVLNVSSSVIGKIRRNFKLGRLEQPGKKRQMTKRVLDKVNTFDEEIIRKIIRDMIARRQTPTIPMILAEAREKIGFVGSRTSFRRILHRMGYKYGMLKSKIEKKMVLGGELTPSGVDSLTPAVPTTSNASLARPPPPTVPISPVRTTNVGPTVSTLNSAIPRLVATAGGIQVSRQPPQIQIIKREKDANASVPLIFNSSGSIVIPANTSTPSSSGNIPQPRQIIIHQGGQPNSGGQQYFAIQQHQLGQLTNNSGQPQIIRIIHTTPRPVQPPS